MINLDGSYLEGGGQIIRTALALSTLTGKSFSVNDIRKGRSEPGLKAQHLYCIKGLKQLCNAKVEGAELGSENLTYTPGRIEGKTISINIGTAGSITLLLQSLLMPSIFADTTVRLKITGGTDVRWSPPFNYFTEVFLPHVNNLADITVKLERRGYYPKGNGKVDITIKPKYRLSDFEDFDEFWKHLKSNIPIINLTQEESLTSICGISHASYDLKKASVAERQAITAKKLLTRYDCPVTVKTEYCDTISTGSGITLWANLSNTIIGADALGEKGKKAELVGQEAAEKLAYTINSKAPVDEHLADNLVPYLALLKGSMRVSKLTNHTLTNICVVERFLGKLFDIDTMNRIISC
jgi:RNA 3'-terminal phosphate cyclase (GTP)